ncbi:MAG: hypothetical protein HC836_31240 [Richelia sp. RM2_1_2]|nr:hypothetical protein [Richelia sp. RM2_1_2]
MTSLLGRKIDQSYTEILKLATSGITSSLQRVQDGDGVNTPISISTTAVSMNSTKISDVANPTLAQDAATKSYVDGLVSSGSNYFKANSTGTAASATSTDGIAIGEGAIAGGTTNSVAIGTAVSNSSSSTVKIGSSNTNYMLLGSNADFTLYDGGGGSATSVIADGSAANINLTLLPKGTGNISASSKRITDVATPTALNDAVNKQYVDSLSSATSNYLKINSTGTAASATGTDAIALGEGAIASNTNSLAIGATASASGSGAVSIGFGVTNSSTNTIRIGSSNTNYLELSSAGNLKLYSTGANVGLAADGSAATVNLTLAAKGASGVISASNFKISNVADPVLAQDAVTKNYLAWENIGGLPTSSVTLVETLKVENGFEDRTSTTISFNNGTRTFTIAPTGPSFTFFAGGLKYTKNSAQTVVIPDTEGTFFIYFDTAGVLTTVPTFTIPIIRDHAYVSSGYWDAANNIAITVGDERHGRVMDAATHAYLHRTLGTRYASGLGFGNIVADSTGDNASAQFSIADGTIHDEDITLDIINNTPQILSPIAQIPLFHREGASGNWRRTNPSTFPMRTSGGTSSTRAAWNNVNAGGVGVWGLSEIPSGQFSLTHVFATNDITYPMIGVIGQAIYTTIGDAQNAALTAIRELTLGQLDSLFQEYKAVGTLIFETNLTYANAVNSRIRTTADGGTWVDFRTADLGSGASGTTVNDHGGLTGLTDDDHTQYSLTSGIRAFSGVVGGVDPTLAAHLSTKNYVDAYSIPKTTATVQTTNAINTTLQTIAIPTGETRMIVARIVGSSTTNNTFWRFLRACVKNVGGTATIVGGVAADQGYDAGAATWSITLDTSGSSARIRVSGAALTTIDWYTTTEITR